MKDVQDKFDDWLSDVLPGSLPDGIVAFNFNISETTMGYSVEVCGASVFDPDDEDWACDETWTCRPSDFYLSEKSYVNWEAALEGVVG